MIYPAELEQKLGFDVVRHKLIEYCASSYAAKLVDEIRYRTDAGEIRTLLRQNLEFKLILEKAEDFPSSHFHDPTNWLVRIIPEGNYLEAEELLDVAYSLETILACKSFLEKSKDKYPELYLLSLPVDIQKKLPQSIFSQIDDRATVKDSASNELARIRKRIREETSRIRKIGDHIFRKAVEQKWVPEGALPTIRDGRTVIPLLAEHKRRITGFIHDESATGQTVFLEPAEMLEANNELRDLEHAELREVIKILKTLTASLHENAGELDAAFLFLQQIDFIRAKARFSLEIGAELPVITEGSGLNLIRARHPLLFLSFRKSGREVIPLSIDLDDHDRMILVSGPNAGGKSVCLKTVGLLQYMIQCGLLVPVDERSEMGLFLDIFLDIGDQQSIENDLSTYSSHLKNMSVFLNHAGSRSLVLMDELGAGTDPDFGGAIAQAVLHSLLLRKAWGVATTHYHNLKLFAGQERGIRNAAMRFDEENLIPLYGLEIGKPGSSFALEIARKTGLPNETLKEAERLVGKELAGFETLVRKLEQERKLLEDKLKEMDKQERELSQSRKKYATLSSELESRKKEIIEKARQEAQELLRDTNREIEKTIRHIRENRAEKKETGKVRQNLRTLTDRLGVSQNKPSPPVELREGDYVRIIGQIGSGVIQVIKGKNAVVQFGEIKTVVALSKLERSADSPPVRPVSRRTGALDLVEKRSVFNPTLDVRGKRVEEVGPLLDQFLDSAILLSQGELRILHGKGEGVLRKVVRDQLKRYNEVASWSDEHVERGGDGITVVVLK